ncbi:hypothetical protein HDU98_002312 [Podochytrium sp. JEL0797]|nr:hypothetical protein HDU98_002312 [Podochytrium sp. JEL0797]
MNHGTAPADLGYTEFRLVSSGSGLGVLAHVARLPPAYPLDKLIAPLFVHRRINELKHVEDPELAEEPAPKEEPAATTTLDQKPKKLVSQQDIDKIAPGSRSALHNMYAAKASGAANARNMPNKFQKKTRQMFFGQNEDEKEDPLARAKKRDPDRFPWILRDSRMPTQEVLVGSVEIEKASDDRVLFVLNPDASQGQGFIVMPVQRIHKFTSRPKFHTFTTEEAEDKMLQISKKGIERWTSAGGLLTNKRVKTEEEIAEEIDGVKLTREERDSIARQLRKLNPALAHSVANAHKPPSRPSHSGGGGNSGADGINEEIDFDEVMSDDEHPEFGIENEEEAREAKKREYGNKAGRWDVGEVDGDREEKAYERNALKRGGAVSKQEKKLKKALKRHEGYHSDEETNLYGEIEEDEDSDPEPEPAPAPPSKPTTPALPLPATSPTLSSHSPSLAAKQAKAKKKEDIRGYDAESAARKAMFGGVNVNAMRDILKNPSSSSLNPSLPPPPAPVVSPTLDVGGGDGAGPRIKLRLGSGASGTSPDVGDQRKRKSGASPALSEAKKAKKEKQPPPPPSSADLIKQANKKSSSNNTGSPSLSKHNSSNMTASSPRLDELRGGNKRKAPSPSVSNHSPSGLTPQIKSASGSPTLSSDNILTENDIRALFARPNPPKTIKEIVALVKDKMKFEENKPRLGALLKACCKKAKGADGTDIWVLR